MRPTTIFLDFLKPLCEGIDGVVYAEISDTERLDRVRQDSVSRKVYPGIFITRPRYRLIDNNAGYIGAKFDVLLYVITKTNPNNRDSEEAAFELAERISVDLATALRHANEDGLELGSWESEPVKYLMVDSMVGYEVQFRLTLNCSSIFC